MKAPLSRLHQVVAMDEDGCIGCDGRLPWHLPADMRRFRWLTLGRPVLMGRRTYESLQVRPLPWRYNIVLSQRTDFKPPGCVVARSLEEALRLAQDWTRQSPGPSWRRRGAAPLVIGGAALYRDTLPTTDRIYLTRVRDRVAGDTWFPQDGLASGWQVREVGGQAADERNRYAMRFSVLERRASPGSSPRRSPLPRGDAV